MSQSLTQLLTHIIFSTKKRQDYLTDDIRAEMYLYLAAILRNLGCVVFEIGGTENHVHILCELSAKMLISELVSKLKSGSTNWAKKTKSKNNFGWQRGYGVFSVSASVKPQIGCYIKNQMLHHKKFSFADEFRMILKKCNVRFDEKYLWD